MPFINFTRKNHAPIEVAHGANLMKSLLAADVPVASSCGGDGVCGKCKMTVNQGPENLSTPNDIEIFLKDQYQLSDKQRISCQVSVLGDIEVETGYW